MATRSYSYEHFNRNYLRMIGINSVSYAPGNYVAFKSIELSFTGRKGTQTYGVGIILYDWTSIVSNSCQLTAGVYRPISIPNTATIENVEMWDIFCRLKYFLSVWLLGDDNARNKSSNQEALNVLQTWGNLEVIMKYCYCVSAFSDVHCCPFYFGFIKST